MPASDLVREHWPHVAELLDSLEAMADHAVTINTTAPDDAHLDAVIDGINRRSRGGPVIFPGAVG